MKIDRLLAITIMLINRPMITAKELSDKFEVSMRTIYRDIESIIAAGIPVVSWQGKKGGFCLMENYRIDRQLLTLNDMTSILLALKGISTTLQNNSISDAIEKIESLVPEDKKEHIYRSFEHIIIDLAPWESSEKQKSTLKIIQQSIEEHKVLSFLYRNLKGEELTREIEPISLILKANCWYVYGFCRTRNDFRIFRLSRIHDCTLHSTTFTSRNRPFVEQEFFTTDNRIPVTFVLRFSPAAKCKVEEFYGQCSKSTDEQGRITVEVTFPEDEWVYSTILSYGAECEVLSPLHVRELIGNRLKLAAQYYTR